MASSVVKMIGRRYLDLNYKKDENGPAVGESGSLCFQVSFFLLLFPYHFFSLARPIRSARVTFSSNSMVIN